MEASSAAPRAGTLGLVWLASALVLAASTLAAFRQGFAEDVPTLLRVNGPRVLFASACGGLLALSGTLRLQLGAVRPLFELEGFALTSGAAGAGFLTASGRAGGEALAAFVIGAVVGGLAFCGLVRALDRPQRWTNFAAAGVLAAGIGAAALAGTYARARRDAVASVVAWLLGDLTGAGFASGGALLAGLALLLAAAFRALGSSRRTALARCALLAGGASLGAAGPLVFVGTLVPRAVDRLARGASARARTLASLAAGAATVSAIDAVPRLLVGGYDFPFAVPAGMLALPVFLSWNRARLRDLAGRATAAFEALEWTLIAGMTLAGVWLAITLTRVIHAAT